jgi:hypothetical protein
MGLKFRRGSTAQQSGSLAFGEPYVNTTLGTLVVGGATGDIVLSTSGTGSTGNFGAISGSGLDITGNANIAGNVTVGGQLTIGDATSDTVNVVASLSSSLIPQTTNVFDLGSANKIWRDLYISTGSIKFVSGNTVVKELSLATITGLESSTGSSNVSLTNLNTTTASLNTSITNLNSFSSSENTKAATLATLTGSYDTRWSNLGSQSGSFVLESETSSFARTNSTNIFSGDQTITGSLFVTSNLIVQGSSSIQNISSSTLNIGTNIITVAVNQPSVRFGGLSVIDSGSAGASGSFLYDSVQDEFIFIHRGNGTNITSSHFVLGPETIDNLGNEIYLTNNRLAKGTGKEHLNDSNITDTGTLITLGSNTTITGTLVASGTTIVSSSAQITGITNAQLSNSTISGKALGTNLDTLVIGTGLSGTSYNGSAGVTIANTGVLAIGGGTGVTVSGANSNLTVAIGQSVATGASPTFAGLTINGAITATGDITAFFTSDKRHKNNIQIIPNALEKVSKLNGVTWEWNDDVHEVTKSTPKTGLIAQEVQEVLPEVVKEREDGFLALDYSKMMGLMVEAIKEQQTQIHSLTIEIEKLKESKGL